ncbi:prolyl oligopeptidase family serine peptidase [Candidatus Latescibacterota bacterium]
MNRFIFLISLCGLALLPIISSAQVVSQSTLTAEDIDPNFKLTLEHLAMDTRWLGLSPREISWSPDGKWIYFRWRDNPSPEQLPSTDPWYAVNQMGTEVHLVSDDEVTRIPPSDIQWSGDRKIAAWSRNGTLFIWHPTHGTQSVFTSVSRLGNISIAWDGSAVYFSTQGLGLRNEAHGDLWMYDVTRRHVRQIANVVAEDDEDSGRTEGGKWINTEELELLEIVRKRKDDREARGALDRKREPFRPQEIPVEEGARIFNIRLSPDGHYLTFMWTKDPSSKHRTEFMEFINESGYATAKKARPKVGDPLPEYKMGIVVVDPTVATKDIEIRWVKDGIEKDLIIHGPYWNPQGTHAVVQILSMDHKDRWISLLDFETDSTFVVDHQHEEAWIGGPLVVGSWNPGFLQWLPEGDAFGFCSVATGWSMLYLGYIDGIVTHLTKGEWEVRGAELSPDGKTWLLTTSQEHPGEEHFYHLPTRGGKLRRITTGEGKHRVAVSPDGERLATLFETTSLLPDLYIQDNKSGASRVQVTKSGTDAFYRYAWIESEIITFSDPAGEPTWAKIWKKPDDFNGAAIVHAHGCGECAQGVDKGSAVRSGATLYANYMYQHGYISASVDYRGSSGYGHRNRTYAYRQMGVSDVDSALPLLDILVERGVERQRIGVYGGSYGGFFTIMSLFRHPGTYAAGVALYPVTDWAHYSHTYTSRILNGMPHEDEEAYRQSSPVYYADGLQDALQIQHGLVDNNVQIQDSFRLAQILMEKKKVFDFMVYPMEDHGWDEEPTRRDSYQRMVDWFDRYLLDSR